MKTKKSSKRLYPKGSNKLTRKVRRVYLDHAAAAPISSKALGMVLNATKKYPGNPSAFHREGREARVALEDARTQVAGVLAARPDELVFTSGATEANNLAILGVVRAAREKGVAQPRIIVSAIEHPAVLETVRALAKEEGALVDTLSVNEYGLVDSRELRKIITPDTVLVSIMYANNEIGSIQTISDIAKEVRHARKMNQSVYPFFHTDAAQAANYLDLNVLRLGVDLMTLSSTKTYGPRGIAALFIKRGVTLVPLMHGGKHEAGRRPGTESPALALGFASALAEARAIAGKESKRVQKLRDLLAEKILKAVPQVEVNGGVLHSLPNILNVSVKGVEGDALVLYLDAKGIAVSGQSACKSSENGPSHVIMAIGKVGAAQAGSIRFSLGRATTREDIVYAAKEFAQIVAMLRKTSAQNDVV